MESAYICDAIRTPFGRYAGTLAAIRTDDLAAISIKALVERNAKVDWNALDDVVYGCANQAGEDNRNVGRMALLLAGLPKEVPGSTVNRLCGSSMDAVATASRAIKSGEAELVIAGGVESMSRAPFVLGKADSAFSRSAKLEDTTIGWRFVNPLMKAKYGTDSMPETGEIVAEEFHISRQDQDLFALRSQQRAADAIRSCRMSREIVPVPIPQKKGEPVAFQTDEYPRAATTADTLARLRPAFVKENGTVTAGNASGINDGAAALLVASEERARLMELAPMAKVLAYASGGVDPKLMGMGPVPAIERALEKAGLTAADIDLFELNEAFAAQSLAVVRELGLDAARVNVNGGAIALGHPIGASGARVLVTLLYEMRRRDARRGLAALCIGGGQGIALIVER